MSAKKVDMLSLSSLIVIHLSPARSRIPVYEFFIILGFCFVLAVNAINFSLEIGGTDSTMIYQFLLTVS